MCTTPWYRTNQHKVFWISLIWQIVCWKIRDRFCDVLGDDDDDYDDDNDDGTIVTSNSSSFIL